MSMRRSSILNIDEWIDKFPDEEPDSIIYESDFTHGIAVEIVQRLTEKLIPNLEKKLNSISGVGFTPSLIYERANEYESYVEECDQIFGQHISDDIDRIGQYKDETLKQVQSMMKDLYDTDYQQDESIPLIQQCKKLRSQYVKMDKIRQKRLEKFRELRDMQISHCLVLGIRAPQFGSQRDIPSEKELDDFAVAVSKLKQKEKDHRERHQQLKKSILKHMDELEYEPELGFEKDLINKEPCYTEDHLNELKEFESKLEAQHSINQEKYCKLVARLKSLFDRLDVEPSERESLLKEYSTSKPSIITLLEIEVERYEELKKQNIGKFIEKMKDELIIEYERCCESQEKQDNFFSLSNVSGECNEELLELYEREYERIKEYYQNNREILDNFHKWRAMWRELIEIELKANDPNRFNNRGGQLLHEERKRKGLQKALPKLEQDLNALCEKYSAKNGGNKLKVYDTELGEFIAGCWDELNTAKEEEKRQRQRAKMTLSRNSGSNNNVRKPLPTLKRTPAKRAAGAGYTPTPSKSKLSLSETEFEHLIRGCPASAKKKR